MIHACIRIVLFTLGFIFTCGNLPGQDKTIVYFDKSWKPCKKENASYYREIYYQSERKPTSIVRDYYLDGRLQWEGKLISENPDVLDSICTWYDEQGRIREQRTYKSGQLNGALLLYNQNGSRKEKQSYKNGLLNGIYIVYWENGKEKVKVNYEDGKMEGERLLFHHNGNIAERRQFREDIEYGVSMMYDSLGRIMTSTIYNNGLIDWIYCRYYPGGARAEVSKYNNGKHLGPDTFWRENGSLERIQTYEKDGEIYFHEIFDEQEKFVRTKTNKEYPDTVSLHIAKDNINCLYGLKNYQGRWVLPAKYNYIYQHIDEEGGFTTTLNDKHGFISSGADFVIEPQYQEIFFLNNGRRKYTTAEPVFAPSFFKVRDHYKYGLLSRSSGKIVLLPEYDEIEPASNCYGLFIIRKNGLYGLTDSSRVLLEPRYSALQHLAGGKSFVFDQRDTINGLWGDSVIIKAGVINLEGDTVIPPVFDFFTTLNDYIWAQKWDTEKSRIRGLYTMDGREIMPPEYRYTEIYADPDFNAQGRDVLRKDSLYYLIDMEGHLLNAKPYQHILALKADNENYIARENVVAIFKDSGLYGLLDRNGKPIIPARYNSLTAFRILDTKSLEKLLYSHYFIAVKNDKYGLITENDSVLIPFECEWIFTNPSGRIGVIRDSMLIDLNQDLQIMATSDPMPKVRKFYRSNADEPFHYGIVNDSDRVLLPPIYKISDFINGKAIFSDRSGIKGYIKDNGKIMYTPRQAFKSIEEMDAGYSVVVSFNGKMGIINETEQLLVDTLYDAIAGFDPLKNTCWVMPALYIEELPAGEVDYSEFPVVGSWGLINTKGQYILDTLYYRPSMFHEGLGVVLNGMYGLVKHDGTIVIPCIYDAIKRQGKRRIPFKEGYLVGTCR